MSHTETIVGDKVVEKVGGKVVSEKDLTHVLAGYKATINNPNTSDEATKHAQDRIKELEALTQHEHTKDPKHVIAGTKAALSNEHVHEDVKVELRQRLKEMEDE
ncbi:hypothetical protein T439DRAFT_358959 [Meredithblackwellia eburnea MCA 4105]